MHFAQRARLSNEAMGFGWAPHRQSWKVLPGPKWTRAWKTQANR